MNSLTFHHSLSLLNKEIVFICPALVIDLKPPSLTDVLSSTNTRHQRGWENARHSWGRASARAELWERADPHTSFSLLECSSITSVHLFRWRNSKLQSECLWYMKHLPDKLIALEELTGLKWLWWRDQICNLQISIKILRLGIGGGSQDYGYGLTLLDNNNLELLYTSRYHW